MENNKKVKIGLRVKPETYERMQKLIATKESRWSLNDVGEVAVEKYLQMRKI